MQILVVDDDHDIAKLLSIYLKNEGYTPVLTDNGISALKILHKNHHISLMILDIMMPGISGIQVLKRVRSKSNLPVIILSAKATDMDKIKGLIGGADDYVTKPFNPIEVMARISSVLRRSGTSGKQPANEISIGSLNINKAFHEVKTITGQKISLTALEFKILCLLASHPNRVFSSEQIFQKIWGTEATSSSAETVMVHMSNLRDKIARVTHDEELIQTVWGVGYKMTDR